MFLWKASAECNLRLQLEPRGVLQIAVSPTFSCRDRSRPLLHADLEIGCGLRADLEIRRSLKTVLLSGISRLRLDPRAISRSPYPPYSAVVIVRNPSFTPIWRSAGGVRADLKIRRS